MKQIRIIKMRRPYITKERLEAIIGEIFKNNAVDEKTRDINAFMRWRKQYRDEKDKSDQAE